MFISYANYKGGINNLIIVRDDAGNVATSLKSLDQAIKNLKRKEGKNDKRKQKNAGSIKKIKSIL